MIEAAPILPAGCPACCCGAPLPLLRRPLPGASPLPLVVCCTGCDCTAREAKGESGRLAGSTLTASWWWSGDGMLLASPSPCDAGTTAGLLVLCGEPCTAWMPGLLPGLLLVGAATCVSLSGDGFPAARGSSSCGRNCRVLCAALLCQGRCEGCRPCSSAASATSSAISSVLAPSRAEPASGTASVSCPSSSVMRCRLVGLPPPRGKPAYAGKRSLHDHSTCHWQLRQARCS